MTTSFVDLISRRPAVGYVRTNTAVDAKKYSELLERNIELEQQLRSILENDIKVDSWFSETIEISAKTAGGAEHRIQTSWREIGRLAVPYLFADSAENFVFRSIAFGLLKQSFADIVEWHCELSSESRDAVRIKFISKNIIAIVTEQRADVTSTKFLNSRVWKMTEHGRIQLSLIIA